MCLCGIWQQGWGRAPVWSSARLARRPRLVPCAVRRNVLLHRGGSLHISPAEVNIIMALLRQLLQEQKELKGVVAKQHQVIADLRKQLQNAQLGHKKEMLRQVSRSLYGSQYPRLLPS